ncbi:hypothetical protein EA770_07135 [Acinetobacter baumannii]|nr:hypothetical protein EA770_07135 [Acinetobacter baumannii]
MARPKENNFTERTIILLRSRAANTCSNPTCKKLTTSAQIMDISKLMNIGVAAHICAASPNGPRFDKLMDSKSVSSIENAIWLCGPCSQIIDREPKLYPVEVLKQWKKEAETRITSNLNKPFLTENETESLVAKRMLQAIGLDIPDRLQLSIKDIANSLSNTVQTLDPRVNVDLSLVNGQPKYNISVNENSEVPIKWYIKPKNISEFGQHLKNLVEHGVDFKSEIDSLKTNSEGINFILPKEDQEGVLVVENLSKLNALVQIEDLDDNILMTFIGDFFNGKKSMSVNAFALDGLMNLKINQLDYEFKKFDNILNISFDFLKWEGERVEDLKYFDSIYKFYNKLSGLKSFRMVVLVEGREIFSATHAAKSDVLNNLFNLINYTKLARRINAVLKEEVFFTSNITFTLNEHLELNSICNAIEPAVHYSDFKCSMPVTFNEEIGLGFFNVMKRITCEREYKIDKLKLFNGCISKTLYLTYDFYDPIVKVKKLKSKIGYKYDLIFTNSESQSKLEIQASLIPSSQLGMANFISPD